MLVNCAVYKEGQKLAEIPVQQVGEYYARDDCFVWVALSEPSAAEFDAIANEFDLHPLLVDDARQGLVAPKLEEYENSVLAVVQTVEYDKAGDDDLHLGHFAIFVAKNYV